MMKIPSACRRVALRAWLAAAFLAALVRILALADQYDPAVGYFDAGAFPTLYIIILALSFAALLVGTVLHILSRRRVGQPSLPPQGEDRWPPLRIAAGVAALLSMAAIAFSLSDLLGGRLPSLVLSRGVTLTLYWLYPIAALLALPAAFLPARHRFWSLLTAMLALLAGLAAEYFDHTVTMNSPLKLLQGVTAVIALLYLATELYRAVPLPCPTRALPLAALTAYLGLVDGLSCIAAAIMGLLPAGYLARSLLLLGIGVIAAARLIAAFRPTQESEET